MPQFDITQFNIYRVEWLPNRIRWFLNDNLIRENTDTVPQEPLRLYLNFYVPSCDWEVACDPNLQHVLTSEKNKTYLFDIDSVRVVFGLSLETECFFSWAEHNHSNYFVPKDSATMVWSEYTYRYYQNTNSYLGIKSTNNHIFYLSGSDGVLQDIGSLSDWLLESNCQTTT